MSTYKVNDYMNKKFNDITKDLPVTKAYNLGFAQGMLECYKRDVMIFGRKQADQIFSNMFEDTDNEFCSIFRTLVDLYNEDTNSKIETIIEKLDAYKTKDDPMTDEHKELIEQFSEFLHSKNSK